jgi:hypothetical protein
MHLLMLCLLFCSLVSILVFGYVFIFEKKLFSNILFYFVLKCFSFPISYFFLSVVLACLLTHSTQHSP